MASRWCCTCGEYVRPGTHGIHVVSYGRAPRGPLAPAPVGGFVAVVVTIAVFVTLALAAFVGIATLLQES